MFPNKLHNVLGHLILLGAIVTAFLGLILTNGDLILYAVVGGLTFLYVLYAGVNEYQVW